MHTRVQNPNWADDAPAGLSMFGFARPAEPDHGPKEDSRGKDEYNKKEELSWTVPLSCVIPAYYCNLYN